MFLPFCMLNMLFGGRTGGGGFGSRSLASDNCGFGCVAYYHDLKENKLDVILASWGSQTEERSNPIPDHSNV